MTFRVVCLTLLSLPVALASGCLIPSKPQECSSDEECRDKYGNAHYCADDGICDQYTEQEFTAAPCDYDTKGPVMDPSTYVIGSVARFTNPGEGELSEPIKLAIDLAVNDLNNGLPPNGFEGEHKFGIIYCDTEGKNTTAVEAAQHLADIGVEAVVGPGSSGSTLAAAPEVFIPNEMLAISPAATSTAVTSLNDKPGGLEQGLVWQTVPDDTIQGQVLAKLATKIGQKKTETWESGDVCEQDAGTKLCRSKGCGPDAGECPGETVCVPTSDGDDGEGPEGRCQTPCLSDGDDDACGPAATCEKGLCQPKQCSSSCEGESVFCDEGAGECRMKCSDDEACDRGMGKKYGGLYDGGEGEERQKPVYGMSTREEDSYAGGLETNVKSNLDSDLLNSDRFSSTEHPNPDVRDSNIGDIDYLGAINEVVGKAPDVMMVWGIPEVWHVIRAFDQGTENDDTIFLTADGGQHIPGAEQTANEQARLDGRIWGTAPSSLPTDYTPFNLFKQRWESEYDDSNWPQTEQAAFISNAYDATFLIGLAAFGADSFEGPELAEAIPELTQSGNGVEEIRANQNDVQKAVSELADGNAIEFLGTSGPIKFNSDGSPTTATYKLWCFETATNSFGDAKGIVDGGLLRRADKQGGSPFTFQSCIYPNNQ